MQELVEGRWVDRRTASRRSMSALVDESDRARERSGCRALRAAGLEQVEPVVLDRELDVLHVAVVTLELVDGLLELPVGAGNASLMRAIGSGVRVPATTSSPWASTRNSPYRPGWPVAGLRLKQTPVAERASRLPKTISITLTAVPSSSEMRYSWR